MTFVRMSRPVRTLTLLLAAIQFAVPAVVSVADGALAQSGRGSGMHVEDVGNNHCKPPHSADCAICQFLSTVHSQTTPAAVAVISQHVGSTPTAAIAQAVASDRRGFNSRAPPTLLG